MRDLVVYNKNNPSSYRVIKSFNTIEELDNYTNSTNNSLELFDKLISSLSTDKMKIIRDYVNSNKGNNLMGVIMNSKKYNKIIPVMYKKDIFDNIDLIEKFKEYFINNTYDVINNFNIGIGNVYFYQDGVRVKVSNAKKKLKINEINSIINSYLDGSNYKKYRDIYFLLKSRGIEAKKINLNDDKEKKDIFYLEDSDDYSRYLRSYSTLGEEEYDKAIDDYMLTYMPINTYKKR